MAAPSVKPARGDAAGARARRRSGRSMRARVTDAWPRARAGRGGRAGATRARPCVPSGHAACPRGQARVRRRGASIGWREYDEARGALRGRALLYGLACNERVEEAERAPAGRARAARRACSSRRTKPAMRDEDLRLGVSKPSSSLGGSRGRGPGGDQGGGVEADVAALVLRDQRLVHAELSRRARPGSGPGSCGSRAGFLPKASSSGGRDGGHLSPPLSGVYVSPREALRKTFDIRNVFVIRISAAISS